MFDTLASARRLFAGSGPHLQRSRATALALGLASLALAAGVVAHEIEAKPSAAPAIEVRIDNFTFEPATITVAPGTTVTWINADDIPHTVAADDRSFHSKPLDTDDHFSFTFTSAGEYAYFCSLHPHMTGKVLVEASRPGTSAVVRPDK
jgi:plastocyanin